MKTERQRDRHPHHASTCSHTHKHHSTHRTHTHTHTHTEADKTAQAHVIRRLRRRLGRRVPGAPGALRRRLGRAALGLLLGLRLLRLAGHLGRNNNLADSARIGTRGHASGTCASCRSRVLAGVLVGRGKGQDQRRGQRQAAGDGWVRQQPRQQRRAAGAVGGGGGLDCSPRVQRRIGGDAGTPGAKRHQQLRALLSIGSWLSLLGWKKVPRRAFSCLAWLLARLHQQPAIL